MSIPYYLPKEPGQSFLFTSLNDGWQPYTIPFGATALLILAVGGGGGGGNGHTAPSTGRGGGGGGGSGAISRLFIPTVDLPAVLHLRVGAGGASAAAGNSTIVGTFPNAIAVGAWLLIANGGGAGGTGTATTAGTGGTAGSVTTGGGMSNLGIFTGIAGQTGGVGGVTTGAVGASITYGAASLMVCGGAGGAGGATLEFAGGAINPSLTGLTGPTIAGGLATGGRGNDGVFNWAPPVFTGGSGGGTSLAAGAGGAGGNATYGCGGGGGGGGVTGGAGGRGGDGFVQITVLF